MLLASEFQFDLSGYVSRCVGLQNEDIGQTPLVSRRPQLLVSSRIEELNTDANAVPHTHNAPFQYAVHLQLATYLRNRLACVIVFHDRSPGNYVQVGHSSQAGNELLRYAFGKELLVWISGSVLQWQNGQGANRLHCFSWREEVPITIRRPHQ